MRSRVVITMLLGRIGGASGGATGCVGGGGGGAGALLLRRWWSLTATRASVCSPAQSSAGTPLVLAHTVTTPRTTPLTQPEGPPLLFIHGFLGHQQNWSSVGRLCSEALGCRTIRIDLRSHGRSGSGDDMTFQSMAADVHETLQHVGVERAAVVGHSLGGKVAIQLASMHPDAVANLSVVDIAPVVYESRSLDHLDILDCMRRVDFSVCSSAAEVDAQLQVNGIEAAPVRNLLCSSIRSVRGHGPIAFNPDVAALTRHYDDILQVPTMDSAALGPIPTMFMRGAFSRYLTQEHMESLIPVHFGECRRETVEDSGHWVHAQKPVETAALLTSFYRDTAHTS